MSGPMAAVWKERVVILRSLAPGTYAGSGCDIEVS